LSIPIQGVSNLQREYMTLFKNRGRYIHIKSSKGITYKYDQAGNLISISDSNSNEIQFKYNREGLLSSVMSPEENF